MAVYIAHVASAKRPVAQYHRSISTVKRKKRKSLHSVLERNVALLIELTK